MHGVREKILLSGFEPLITGLKGRRGGFNLSVPKSQKELLCSALQALNIEAQIQEGFATADPHPQSALTH
jgi:hypothetical protein